MGCILTDYNYEGCEERNDLLSCIQITDDIINLFFWYMSMYTAYFYDQWIAVYGYLACSFSMN